MMEADTEMQATITCVEAKLGEKDCYRAGMGYPPMAACNGMPEALMMYGGGGGGWW